MNGLEVIGLLLNLFGTLILAKSSLTSIREFDEEKDRNTYFEKDGKHKYTNKRIKNATRLNRLAIAIVILGFIITLLGLFY